MLEEPTLLLCPRDEADSGPAGVRVRILEPASRRPRGFVRSRRPGGFLDRLCWWRRPVLAVHESEDEPLLLTARQGFLPGWLVEDADGHRVGRVSGPRLLDAINRPLGILRRGPGADSTVYRTPEGDELASTEWEEEGVRLTFLAGARDNPFVKMLLLAAALVHNRDRLWSALRSRPART